MGRFDYAILMAALDREIEELESYANSAYNDFFDEEVLNELYELNALKEKYSEDPAYKSLGLDARYRMVNCLFMLELSQNPYIRLNDLADFKSKEAKARKKQAQELLISLFQEKAYEELKEILEKNTKEFRKKLEEHKKLTVDKSEDQEEALREVLSIGEIAGAHRDGFWLFGGIGMSKTDMEADAALTLMYENVDEKKNSIIALRSKKLVLDGAGLSRAIPIRYLMCKAGLEHGVQIIKNGEYKNMKTAADTQLEILTKAEEELQHTTQGIIAKLSTDELTKMIFTPSLKDKIKVDFSHDLKNASRLTITFNRLNIYDSEDKTVVADDDERIELVKNLISFEYDRYFKEQFESPIGADCFNDQQSLEWLVKDIQTEGNRIADKLARRTNKIKTTKYYRNMQKEIDKFNESYANFTVDNFKDDESRAKAKEKLGKVVETIKAYLDHKHALDGAVFVKDYEKNRVDAAKEAYAYFKNMYTYFDSADKYYAREELFQKDIEKIEAKYEKIENELRNAKGLDKVLREAEEAAHKMAAIGNANNDLTLEEKNEIRRGFEKMCILAIVSELKGMEDKTIQKLIVNTEDEKLLERIRLTPKYKELFAVTKNINAGLVKKILDNNFEDDVKSAFNKSLSEHISCQEKTEKIRYEVEYRGDLIKFGTFDMGAYEHAVAEYIAEHSMVDEYLAKHHTPGELLKLDIEELMRKGFERVSVIKGSEAFKALVKAMPEGSVTEPEKLYTMYVDLLKHPEKIPEVIKEAEANQVEEESVIIEEPVEIENPSLIIEEPVK